MKRNNDGYSLKKHFFCLYKVDIFSFFFPLLSPPPPPPFPLAPRSAPNVKERGDKLKLLMEISILFPLRSDSFFPFSILLDPLVLLMYYMSIAHFPLQEATEKQSSQIRKYNNYECEFPMCIPRLHKFAYWQ